MRPVVRW